MLLSRLARPLALYAAVLPALAFAQRATTADGLARMEETLTQRIEDGVLRLADLQPALVVSVLPAFEETRAWYPTAAVASLARVFGAGSLRACEACMTPRLYVAHGRLEQNSTSPAVDELARLDEAMRGKSAPAVVAIWLDENESGVSLRIVDLRTSQILLAENFDPRLREMARTTRNFTLTRELERRARGEALTHTFIDAAVYPKQHFSFDFAEQWGPDNCNLSGLTVALYDPIGGVGGAYYRIIPQALNAMIGGQVTVSIPTAIASGISGNDVPLFDPLITATLVIRFPIGSSNYGILATASTNGRFGVGISLMNFTLLPVLP